MKHVFIFVLIFAAFSMTTTSFAWAAKSSKSEPTPIPHEDRESYEGDENRPGSSEETYEGNDRDEEYSDLFNAPIKLQLGTVKTVTEDRGAVIVVTTTRMRAAFPEDTCAFITVQIVDKKSGEVLSSDSVRSCDQQIL